jgi:hypothetical protein
VGGDPLSRIQRILTIAVGILLSTVSVSLFLVAWRGRFPVTAKNTNSMTERLLAHAFCAAPSAFVFGVFLIRTIKDLNILDFTVVVVFGIFFLRTFGVVFWSAMTAVAIYPVRRDAKRLADAVASSHITSVQRDRGNK